MTPPRPEQPAEPPVLTDATWREDYPYSLKFNHKHRDGTKVAHDVTVLCPELRLHRASDVEREAAAPFSVAELARAYMRVRYNLAWYAGADPDTDELCAAILSEIERGRDSDEGATSLRGSK